MLIACLLMFAGFVLLVLGGEFLVKGASSLASMLRISPLVIGLTVVAFGTSAPELAVSVQSAFNGDTALAIGNIVGSNIANILLILGVAAIIGGPLVVDSQIVRTDVPFMIAASFLVWGMGADGEISRFDGLILAGLIITYTIWLIRKSRKENKQIQEEFAEETPQPQATLRQVVINFLFLGLGIGILTGGSDLLVRGATSIAETLGVPTLIVGLTIVAIGTSLPELVTSITACYRGHGDIAVGNAVGSNLFNLLSVLGFSSIVAPNGIEISTAALEFDIPIMIAVSVACIPIFLTGYMIYRWEGVLFLGYYIAYLTYLVLVAMKAPFLPTFETAMMWFVIPLTVITVLVAMTNSIRGRRKAS